MGIPFAELELYPKFGHNSYYVYNLVYYRSNSLIFLLLSLTGKMYPNKSENGTQSQKPIPNSVGSFKTIFSSFVKLSAIFIFILQTILLKIHTLCISIFVLDLVVTDFYLLFFFSIILIRNIH